MNLSFEDVFAFDKQVVNEHSPGFVCLLQGVVLRAYPALQDMKVKAIVLGWKDETLNRLAASYSFHSGYDGYDAIEEGYRAIVRGLLGCHREANERLNDLRGHLVEMLWRYSDLFERTSWALILETGICCEDFRTHSPSALDWGSFDSIYLKKRVALFMCQDRECLEFYFPGDQFPMWDQRRRILNGIAKLSEMNGFECRVIVEDGD